MEHIPRLSEAVYVSMCCIAGTPTQIAIRRSILQEFNKVLIARNAYSGTQSMLSGSRSEGFHLNGSDWDFMSWPVQTTLVCDLNQAGNIPPWRLMLMENCEGRPGFVLLQHQSISGDDDIFQSTVVRNRKYYVKSSLYKEITLARFRFHPIIHGPCASGKLGEYEIDHAYSFHCDYWSPIADQFISRCQTRGWPVSDILENIIGDGCHVVPIGLKGSPEEDFEWRMSFSAAEMKLVHCMNHTQFMCYGLLKVFLKEALDVADANGQSLLCSYFMKTVLFWVIQSNSNIEWSPPNLLSGFWMCFKGLSSCVQRGYLPNFFIPENNMFRSKIYGHSQQLLRSRLLELYNIGIACLLHCPSVRPFFLQTILDRKYVANTEEMNIMSTAEMETLKQVDMLRDLLRCYCTTIQCCFQCNRHFIDTSSFMLLSILENRPSVTLSFQGLLFEILSSDIVRYIANHLFKFPANNKVKLIHYRSCEALLALRVRHGCFSHLIYLALFYYVSGQKQKVLPLLETLRRRYQTAKRHS